MKTLSEFLTLTTSSERYYVRPRLDLESGLTLSVQGHETSYSKPKSALSSTYETLEIRFPSEKINDIMKYAEEKENPTGTVYGHVPYHLIEKIISDNGGIKE